MNLNVNMLFTIGLVLVFVLFVIAIFAYQKFFNPGKLCNVCYRVVPDLIPECPFCETKIKW